MTDQGKNPCAQCNVCVLKKYYSAEELDYISQNTREVTIPGGEVIMKQGSFVSQIVYLKSGLIKVLLEGNHHKQTILRIEGKNKYIGLPVLGEATEYLYTAAAVTESVVCLIRHESMLEIMRSNGRVNEYMLKMFAQEHTSLFEKIDTLSNKNSQGKLAAALLYLTGDNFEEDVLNEISRKELAELAGISIEGLQKILNDLKNEKIISVHDKKISIERPDLIEMLSTVG